MPVPISVHLPPELLERVRTAAQADDRTFSEWVRQAVEHELRGFVIGHRPLAADLLGNPRRE
jgi:predicted DNA-binding protein